MNYFVKVVISNKITIFYYFKSIIGHSVNFENGLSQFKL